MEEKTRFFVLNLGDRDFRPSPQHEYEVQLLDSNGRAKQVGYLTIDQDKLEIEVMPVPFEVIRAAKEQPVGQGDYVDSKGISIDPF